MATHYQPPIVTSEDIHPVIRVRSSSWVEQPNGGIAHYSGTRDATIRQAIELEAGEYHSRRPSRWLDARTPEEKRREWVRMLLTNLRDALTLLRIDRYPPMVTWDYDDSDDWPGKRWRRALALHKGEVWSTRTVLMLNVEKPAVPSPFLGSAESESREIPRFLLPDPPDL